LQEYALRQITLPTPNPRFGLNSQRHETMKAVLLNSADKLAGVHGSTRDVWDNNLEDWTQSEAYSNDELALDDVMGAGHLNAKRAVQQLVPGEYDPGFVPAIGWDYDSVGGSSMREYTFDSIIGSGYFAATLVWDRRNEHSGGNTYHDGDQFFFQTVEESLNNLDLYLLPADATELTPYIAASTTLVDNVEHIFFNILTAGNYKLVVHNNSTGGIGDAQNYGLAWWFGNPPALTAPGDYNGDGNVDAADYIMWRKGGPLQKETVTPGMVTLEDYDEWRSHFGNPVFGSGNATSAPEPFGVALMLTGIAFAVVQSRRCSVNRACSFGPPLVFGRAVW
jgi:hypothetical protein